MATIVAGQIATAAVLNTLQSVVLTNTAGSAAANSTTPVQIAAGSFTAVAGTRPAVVMAQCNIQSTVATDLGRVTVNVDGVEVARYQLVPGAAGSAGVAFGAALGSLTLLGGDHTWTVTVLRVTGTGTVTGGLSLLTIQDAT